MTIDLSGLTKAQRALLDRAVQALDHAKGKPGYRAPGDFTVFDGRKWPAIRVLRDRGLLTVEEYDGRGYRDTIVLRATEAARQALNTGEQS